jgi:drug/metabolite transporter (DMT)-like permease
VFPSQISVWFQLIIAGSLLAGSQLLAALSYRFGKAERVSLVAYLTPVLTCFLDYMLFDHGYSITDVVGIFMILLSTVSAIAFVGRN